MLLLAAFCGFLFFYGLGAFGLLGADEPRYAQVAREMLDRSDWVTPVLQGKAWLEKPPLYYWQAMLTFRIAGVGDKIARLPSAFDATLLVAAIYLFLRRFRPGSELDGALIAASCAGVIGFARAAATDMPLAAMFGIALLSWYAWYESRERKHLAVFYIALALGTLAKGPVAPALSAMIIFLFVAVRREWDAIWRTLWVPGIGLYLALTLPWYVMVEVRNPEFFRFFFLEHNLARFSQDLYHHRQPFWYYIPVFLLAMMPWAVVLIVAITERARIVWSGAEKPCFWRKIPGRCFFLSGCSCPSYFSAHRNRSCRDIFSLRFRRARYWSLNISRSDGATSHGGRFGLRRLTGCFAACWFLPHSPQLRSL